MRNEESFFFSLLDEGSNENRFLELFLDLEDFSKQLSDI
jgi:hypothetical protein